MLHQSGKDEPEDEETTAMSSAAEMEEIFYIYNARDEREPHSFIKMDPFYQQGIVSDWDIKELDLIHKERDDELMV